MPFFTHKPASHEDVTKIVLMYVIFAGLWIVLSDWALDMLIADMAFLHVMQTLKGWLFVGCTALLLYFLLNAKQRDRAETDTAQPLGLVDWPRWQLYLFALAMPFVSLLLRDAVAVSFDERPLLLLFMFPIILSAALGGLGPGVVSTLLCALLVTLFVITPKGSLSIQHSYDLFQIGFLIGDGLLISFLSRMLHDARARAEVEKSRAEQSLDEKTRALLLLDGISKSSSDAIFAKDINDCYILFNPGAERMSGKKASEVLGRDERAVFPQEIAARLIADNRQVMLSNKTASFQEEIITPDGRRTLLTTKGPLQDSDGKVIGMFGIARDISEFISVEAALRRERDRNQSYLDNAQTFMLALDSEGRVSMINRYGCELLGYPENEIIGQNWFGHYLPQEPATESVRQVFRQIMLAELEGERYHENQVVCRDGSRRLIGWHNAWLKNEAGAILGTLSSGEDITDKKLAEAEIHRLAFYDPLTGFPNRALLLERLSQILSAARRNHHFSALVCFNIDRFKTINDAGGQEMGDTLLREVGERLSHSMRAGDVVARTAGDEFCILLNDLSHLQQSAAHFALHVADKIHTSLHKPFLIGDKSITLSACLGIALLPENDQDTPLDILRRANTALHHAKTEGRGQTAFFEGTLDEIAKQRFEVERELHQAINAGELRVFLQPQVDAAGRIVGAEALVRWQHPERGLVQPGAFIPIAEESNLIVEIGIWVFTEVCRLLAREEMSATTQRIAVNISPRHFRQPDFVSQFKRIIGSTGIDPAHLTLEVTESMLIDNLNDVIAKMNELNALGIHFSLDDFGTGYSSLSYLKRLPINELKIDKTFIHDMTSNPNDASLVETILMVAQHMRLRVVAEGVETREQADFLNQRATVIHQGYLFGKPEPAETMLKKMAAQEKN